MARTIPARNDQRQGPLCLRKRITFANAGQTVDVGTLPAGSIVRIPLSGVHVHVAFNGDSSNVISIGASTDSGTNDMASAISLAAIGLIVLDENTTTKLIAVDTKVVAAVTATASATAGVADVVIDYIPPNDG